MCRSRCFTLLAHVFIKIVERRLTHTENGGPFAIWYHLPQHVEFASHGELFGVYTEKGDLNFPLKGMESLDCWVEDQCLAKPEPAIRRSSHLYKVQNGCKHAELIVTYIILAPRDPPNE